MPAFRNGGGALIFGSLMMQVASKNDSETKNSMQQVSNPLNILLADDETSTTAAVSYVLKRVGHRVDVVHDGQAALELIKKSPEEYHLLITDHLMQNLSGLELAEKVVKTTFHGRILVLSAYVSKDLETSYRKFGITQFVNKPFDIVEHARPVTSSTIVIGYDLQG